MINPVYTGNEELGIGGRASAGKSISIEFNHEPHKPTRTSALKSLILIIMLLKIIKYRKNMVI
jgi:hypothetical protein